MAAGSGDFSLTIIDILPILVFPSEEICQALEEK